MKASLSLLPLAATALANNVVPAWNKRGETETTTMTTITTTTVCPLTETSTAQGT